MKSITTYHIVRNNNGIAQTSATVNVYPKGTTNGTGITNTHQGGGLYKTLIEPSVDVQCMSKLYDVYVSGVKIQSNQFFENWVWKVADKEIRKETTLTYSALTDENGEALPATISNAEITLLPKTDRLGLVSAITSTNFVINISDAGGADYGVFDIIIKKTK